MSHYVVIVTNASDKNKKNLKKQLEPFSEQGTGKDYFMQKEYVLEKGTLEEIKGYVKNNHKPLPKNIYTFLFFSQKKFYNAIRWHFYHV